MQISIITYFGKDSDATVFEIKVMVMSMVVCSCSQKLVGVGVSAHPCQENPVSFAQNNIVFLSSCGEPSIN
jgi:hypothetical protein